MHVDCPIVGSTQNAKLVAIRHDVYVYQGIRETLVLHAPYVSSPKSLFVYFLILYFRLHFFNMHDFKF